MAGRITMAVTPTAVPKDEQQSVIRFLTLENVSGIAHTKWTVKWWVQKFKVGQMSTSNEPQSGRT